MKPRSAARWAAARRPAAASAPVRPWQQPRLWPFPRQPSSGLELGRRVGFRLLARFVLLALLVGHLGFDLVPRLLLDLLALGGLLPGFLARRSLGAQPGKLLLVLQALRFGRQLRILCRLVDGRGGGSSRDLGSRRTPVADQGVIAAGQHHDRRCGGPEPKANSALSRRRRGSRRDRLDDSR